MTTTCPNESALAFISWAEHCSRSDSIAARLGGKSHMMYSPFWGSRYATVLFKYFAQTYRTLRVLTREKPEIVIVMAPPVVACFGVWLYCLLTGARFAIDAHTGAFLNPRWQRVLFLQRFFSRRAVTTIVTNEYLREMVEGWSAHATVVTDVPVVFPDVSSTSSQRIAGAMVLVSSFCDDEPIEAFMAAAATLPDIRFYVTGDYSTVHAAVVQNKPNNVELTGFLSNTDYVQLLCAADAVIVLTTCDHTMQRGAYEAIYLGKPVVTSHFEILRRAFPKGTVHVAPTAAGIVNGIRALREDLPSYTREALALRTEKLTHWEHVATSLKELLQIDQQSVLVKSAR